MKAKACSLLWQRIVAAASGARVPYVLLERDTSQPVGMLEARPAGHTVDFGYVLASERWGLGYMPEAITRLADVALGVPAFFRLQAVCDVENRASQRALETAGFKQEGRHERFIVHPNRAPDPRPCYMFARCR